MSGFHNFDKTWKIQTITDGFVFTRSPSAVTTVCYFPPIYIKDIALIEAELRKYVESFFLLPEGSIVSSYLIKQEKDWLMEPQLGSIHEAMNTLEKKRIESVNRRKTYEYQTYFSLTVPIELDKKKSGIVGSIKKFLKKEDAAYLYSDEYIDLCRNAVELLENTISQIQARFNGACFRLKSKQTAKFVGYILNHSSNTNVTDLSSILTSDLFSNMNKKVTYYGGNYHSTLSLRSKGCPHQAGHKLYDVFYNEQIKDIPFIVKSSLFLLDPTKAKKQAAGTINQIALYIGLPFIKHAARELIVQKELMEAALNSIELENGRLVDINFQVLTWSGNTKQLEKNVRNISNIFNGFEIQLKNDDLNHKPTFHSFLPFLGHINPIKIRLTSMNAECFTPVVYPPYYVNDPDKPLDVRTLLYTGYDVLTEFDIMDKRDPSWNGIICGGSGSGKSFFTNYLIQNHLRGNGKVFIIDKGGPGQGSFRNLVMNIKSGRYIDMKFRGETEFSINFFDGPLFVKDTDSKIIEGDIEGVPDVDKEVFLTQVISMMCSNDPGDRFSKKFESDLSEAIRRAYLENNNNDNNFLSLEYFAEHYMMRQFPEHYEQIRKYIEDGPYAKFFRKSNDLGDTQIFCFDLEGLSEHPDLEPILTLIITKYCSDLSLSEPDKRKMTVIDEAWAALMMPSLRATVENIWRTARKHNAYIYCVTQSLSDIIGSEIAKAILANTTHYFMCGANHSFEDLSRLKATGEYNNAIDAYDYECIRQMKFKKGEFSEIFMLSPVFKGVLRYRASEYDYWLSTTNAEDKQRIESFKKKHNTTFINSEVLEDLVKCQ